MKRVILLVVLVMILTATAAMAMTVGEIIAAIGAVVSIKALVASAASVLLGLGMFVRYTTWGSSMLIVVGTAITDLGVATGDGKLSVEEIDQLRGDVAAIKRKWYELPWRKK